MGWMQGEQRGGDCHAQHPHFGLRKFGENAPSQWEQSSSLKDTPDHTNHWGYTPWLSMSLGSDIYK